jgi:hypothetical protein
MVAPLLKIGFALTAAGTVASAIKGFSDAGKLKDQAEAVREANRLNETQELKKIQNLVSTQRAIFGASGLDVDYGTPQFLQTDTWLEYERSKYIRQYETDVTAKEMSSRASGAKIGAGVDLLSGFGGMATQYAFGKKQGIF